MCNEVIVLLLILDLQLAGEWMSFAMPFFCSMDLYFPEPFFMLVISDVILLCVCFFCCMFMVGMISYCILCPIFDFMCD